MSDESSKVKPENPRWKADYGDFTEYEVRCLVAEFCRSVTVGTTGWGLSFIDWVEVRGIARHDKRDRLIRLPSGLYEREDQQDDDLIF